MKDIIELDIIDMNHMGQGVAKLDDFVYFVNDTIPGDKVKAQIIEKKKSYAICSLAEIIQKSPNRIASDCEYSKSCGGCQLLCLKYDEQLKYKKNRVINELKRTALDLTDTQIYDTIGMENPFRYRNKTAFSVGTSNGKIQIGTFEQSSHQLVDIEKCLLQDELADKIIGLSKKLFGKYNIQPYNAITKRGIVRHIVIRKNINKDIMLIIVTNTEELPNTKGIVQDYIAAIPQIKTIVQNINNKNNRVILGNKNKSLYGEGTIIDYIGDLQFVISPHTFFQVNSEQTKKLYECAVKYASLTENDVCFDLYCGVGTISLLAAQKSKAVYGVELVEQSINDAKKNAIKNNITNTEFFTGKVEEVLPKLYKKSIKADVIIVDPPRVGCEKEVLKTIINLNPSKVVYVSCNPATLARDLKIMQENGYKVNKVQPVDMFGNSCHVECVVLLTKNN